MCLAIILNFIFLADLILIPSFIIKLYYSICLFVQFNVVNYNFRRVIFILFFKKIFNRKYKNKIADFLTKK